jgi:hypothetical protein
MRDINLQDEVNRKGLETLEHFDLILKSGQFTADQSQHILGLLQTAFSGLLSSDVDGLFVEFITEMSSRLKAGDGWKITLTRIYAAPDRPHKIVTISGATLSLQTHKRPAPSDFSRVLDTPSEAFARSGLIHEKLLQGGYRLIGARK